MDDIACKAFVWLFIAIVDTIILSWKILAYFCIAIVETIILLVKAILLLFIWLMGLRKREEGND